MAWIKKFFQNPEESGVEETGGEGEANIGYSENDEEAQLALDVFQTKDNVIVKSTVAGVKPEDLDISLSGDTVTIRGQRRNEESAKDEDYVYQECYWGSFYRSIKLPVEIDPDKAEADLKDGVLVLTLSKAAKSRVKKLRVRGEE